MLQKVWVAAANPAWRLRRQIFPAPEGPLEQRRWQRSLKRRRPRNRGGRSLILDRPLQLLSSLAEGNGTYADGSTVARPRHLSRSSFGGSHDDHICLLRSNRR